MTGWKLFAVVLPTVLLLDLVWLGTMSGYFSREFGEIARRRGESLAPRWPAAALVYVLIPAGLVLFVRPAIGGKEGWLPAACYGALFGLIVYGVYDLTNLATLERWNIRLAAVDTAWGVVSCAISASVMKIAERWFR